MTTKYRRDLFSNAGVWKYTETKIREIRKYHPVIEIKKMNHDRDHVHMLISIPPTIRVGKVVGAIKSNTSRHIKKKFPFLEMVYFGTDGIWSDSYFVSTVGVNEEIIRRYVEYQGKQDSGQAKLEL
jgi:putative transposase